LPTGRKRYLSRREVVTMAPTQSKLDGAEDRVTRLLSGYAQKPLGARPDPRLSLRQDLGIESLSLVSLVVRLGDELGVDAADDALDLSGLVTVGDLVALARRLESAPAVGVAHTTLG
jgi:acyl carrier protein